MGIISQWPHYRSRQKSVNTYPTYAFLVFEKIKK